MGFDRFIAVICVLCIVSPIASSGKSEQERATAWHADPTNSWPPTWQNETDAFKEAMAFRESELMRLPGRTERWENFMQYTQSWLVPRFTPVGFKIVQTPPDIQRRLKEKLDEGLVRYDTLRKENIIHVLYTPEPSRFIDLHGLDWTLLRELQSLHEEWSGMKLIPTSAYGLRLNSNQSSLSMHYDKCHSHIISSIVHVGHQYDDDDHPWPIEIEDHNGKLQAFNLEPGQMLFYESASCLHGRRQRLHGKYYASIFMHFMPVGWSMKQEEIVNRVPPHWHEDTVEAVGNRGAGQCLTIDSRVSDAAPPRMIDGVLVPDIKAYYENYHKSKKTKQSRSNSARKDL